MKTAPSDNAFVRYTVLGCQMFTLSTAKALLYLLMASAVAVENPVEKSAIGLVIVPFWVICHSCITAFKNFSAFCI